MFGAGRGLGRLGRPVTSRPTVDTGRVVTHGAHPGTERGRATAPSGRATPAGPARPRARGPGRGVRPGAGATPQRIGTGSRRPWPRRRPLAEQLLGPRPERSAEQGADGEAEAHLRSLDERAAAHGGRAPGAAATWWTRPCSFMRQGQPPGQVEHGAVEERDPGLERCRHGGPVELGQDVVGQVADQVQPEHLLGDAAQGRPGRRSATPATRSVRRPRPATRRRPSTRPGPDRRPRGRTRPAPWPPWPPWRTGSAPGPRRGPRGQASRPVHHPGGSVPERGAAPCAAPGRAVPTRGATAARARRGGCSRRTARRRRRRKGRR